MRAILSFTWNSEGLETTWIIKSRTSRQIVTQRIKFSIEFGGQLNRMNTILNESDIREIEKAVRNQFQDKTIITDDDEKLKFYYSIYKGAKEIRTMPFVSIERFAEWTFRRINAMIKTKTKSLVEVLSVKCFDGFGNHATYRKLHRDEN
tara:strand:- start:12971 stop:13417 length:447 start_codon:yes stop_codon:yes gene_type:complete